MDLMAVAQHLKVYGCKGDWWVADYARNRGKAPALIAGPYRTRLEAEVAVRKAAGAK